MEKRAGEEGRVAVQEQREGRGSERGQGQGQISRSPPAPKSGSIFRVAHLPRMSAAGIERPGPLTPTAVQGPQLFEFPVELAEPSMDLLHRLSHSE